MVPPFLYQDSNQPGTKLFLHHGDLASTEWILTVLRRTSSTHARESLRIRSLVGYQVAIRWDVTKPNGQPRRCLDTSRARRIWLARENYSA